MNYLANISRAALLLTVMVSTWHSDAFAQQAHSSNEAKPSSGVLVTTDQGIQHETLTLKSFEDKVFTFVDQGNDNAEPQLITIPASQLVWWQDPHVPATQGSLVRLRNGTTLTGQVTFADTTNVRITSVHWQPVELPVAAVQSIEAIIPTNRSLGAAREAWLAERSAESKLESKSESRANVTVLLNSGDSLKGSLVNSNSAKAANAGTGFTLSSEGREYQFSFGANERQVAAIFFSGKEPNGAQPDSNNDVFDLSLSDGSLLRGNDIAIRQDRIVMNCGSHEIELRKLGDSTGNPVASMIRGIRNNSHEASYLTSLVPAEFQHTPLLGTKWTSCQINRPENRNRFSPNKINAPFSIVMPLRSSLIYRIDEPRENMKFQFGVLVESLDGKANNIEYQILALDSNSQWQSVHASEISSLHASSELKCDEVEIGSAQAIALTVAYGTRADVACRFHWLMPRLTSPEPER